MDKTHWGRVCAFASFLLCGPLDSGINGRQVCDQRRTASLWQRNVKKCWPPRAGAITWLGNVATVIPCKVASLSLSLKLPTQSPVKGGIGSSLLRGLSLLEPPAPWTLPPGGRRRRSPWAGRRSSRGKKEVAQSCQTLGPMDCSPPGSSSQGISQARILEWVAISFSRGSSWPRDRTWVSRIAGRRFTFWATREAQRDVPGTSPVRIPVAGLLSRKEQRELLKRQKASWEVCLKAGTQPAQHARAARPGPQRKRGHRGDGNASPGGCLQGDAPGWPQPGGAHAAQRRCMVLAHGAERIVKWQPWKYWERACVRIIYIMQLQSGVLAQNFKVILKLNKQLHTDLYIFHEVQW